MHLNINDSISLKEIQKVFSAFYPFLKIEFYNKRHNTYAASHELNLIDPDILLGKLNVTHVAGTLNILPSSRVSEVEKEFQRRFGLSVQIFRKEKDIWEQTTDMDDFTIKELNEFGRSSSDEFIMEDGEDDLVEG